MTKHTLRSAQVEGKYRQDVRNDMSIGYLGLEVYVRLSPVCLWIVTAEFRTARLVR